MVLRYVGANHFTEPEISCGLQCCLSCHVTLTYSKACIIPT